MSFIFGKTDLLSIAKNATRPFYFYDLDDAVGRAKAYAASGAQVHYAMKANSNLRLLKAYRRLGLGVDVVSLGEMQKALAAGFAPNKIIFSGVGKDRAELESALHHGILQVNAESFEELQLFDQICGERRQNADVAIRLNIHIEAPTHKNIQTATLESKFGLDQRQLPEVLAWFKTPGRRLSLKSMTVHIGSQILDIDVFEKMAREMGRIFSAVRAQGFALERIDLGGGLGIDYQSDGAEDLPILAKYLKSVLAAHGTGAQVMFEPGRFLVARMGVLLAKVVYIKKSVDRDFAILNAGMNHLMRPALYQAHHRILALEPRGDFADYDIVGPICESTDVFARGRRLSRLERGDWLGIFEAGAYGAVMANSYNESILPAEWSALDGVLELS